MYHTQLQLQTNIPSQLSLLVLASTCIYNLDGYFEASPVYFDA